MASPTAVAFSPTSLSGLHSWWDASQITGLADGDPVASWSDMSGGGHTLTQATSAQRPTYKTSILNGKPVVRFDGVDDKLDTASFTLAQPFTVIFAAVPRGLPSFSTPFDAVSGSACTVYFNSVYRQQTTLDVSTTLTPVVGTAEKVFATYNAASSAFARNGTSVTTNPGTGGTTTGLRVGASRSGSFAQHDFAEFLIYSRAITTTERQQIEAYFLSKYGF